MGSHFWHDYSISICVETRWYRDDSGRVYPEFRVEGQDTDGHALLGAKSPNDHSEAFWRLCDFIDGELLRRQNNHS